MYFDLVKPDSFKLQCVDFSIMKLERYPHFLLRLVAVSLLPSSGNCTNSELDTSH